jgi:hypothetical protein
VNRELERAIRRARRERWENTLLVHIRAAGLPEPEREYRFLAPGEGPAWRFDFAWPEEKLAAEVEGGAWVEGGGRHNRAQGFSEDCNKYNRAALHGWRLVRFTADMVADGHAIDTLIRALKR